MCLAWSGCNSNDLFIEIVPLKPLDGVELNIEASIHGWIDGWLTITRSKINSMRNYLVSPHSAILWVAQICQLRRPASHPKEETRFRHRARKLCHASCRQCESPLPERRVNYSAKPAPRKRNSRDCKRCPKQKRNPVLLWGSH